MLALPNSAPDWFTPKNWNLVREPEQTPLEGLGADVVLDGVVGPVVAVPAVPGIH